MIYVGVYPSRGAYLHTHTYICTYTRSNQQGHKPSTMWLFFSLGHPLTLPTFQGHDPEGRQWLSFVCWNPSTRAHFGAKWRRDSFLMTWVEPKEATIPTVYSTIDTTFLGCGWFLICTGIYVGNSHCFFHLQCPSVHL
jgi:beta-xylosidase